MARDSLLFQSIVVFAFGLGLIGALPAGAVSVQVTVENLAPAGGGNFLTPVWVGFHNGSFDLYDIGVAASPGLERLAEDGTTASLSGEFLSSSTGVVDGTIVGPGGPLAPRDIAIMTFDLDGSLPSSRYFSYASMVIPSNDAFIANGNPTAHQIFDAGGNFLGAEFFVLGAEVTDAGTEVNDEIPANTAFLAQMAPDTGVPEGSTVQFHPGFIQGGDVLTAFPRADFTVPGYKVARITVSAVPEPSTFLVLGMGLLGLIAYQKRRK